MKSPRRWANARPLKASHYRFAKAKPRVQRISLTNRKEAQRPSIRKTGQTNQRNTTAAGQPSGRRATSISPVGKHWKTKPAVVIRRDQKELCNLSIPEGFAEYRWRILLMLVRQNGVCCDCGQPLTWAEATFEHENGRGAAKRDDRIALFEDGHFIRHINGAAHQFCNSRRGSTRTEIYHGNNASFQL